MSPSPPHSVLVVEDERLVARDLQQTLQELGYDAFAVASSADEAIARASERRPDLVLMDIRIEGARDGIEAADVMRRRFDVPVVYLTAHADDATIARANQTEPQGYLVKPVTRGALRSTIEVAIHRNEVGRQLRQRERWFATTLRSIADAVVAVDVAGHVTFMNAAAEALTGISATEAQGKPAHEVVRLRQSSEAVDTDETPLTAALREGRVVKLVEGSLRNAATGRDQLISDSAAPVVGEQGTLGAVMVFRDVTEQRKVQAELELSARMASLGTMAAGVAHEINNPLAVLLTNADHATDLVRELRDHSVLGTEAANEQLDHVAEVLADTRVAIDRICDIVKDMRVFSRPTHRVLLPVDVKKCLEWAIRTTVHEHRWRAHVVTHFASTPRVRADETRLGQVFINVLINASHAIALGDRDANRIAVTTSVERGSWVVIEIEDTGSGIAPDNLARIFDPFFTTKGPLVGTGLGLSICHTIVTSLGGDISVESELGRGTKVRIRLPSADAGGAPGDRPS